MGRTGWFIILDFRKCPNHDIRSSIVTFESVSGLRQYYGRIAVFSVFCGAVISSRNPSGISRLKFLLESQNRYRAEKKQG
ncbi:MAG: hypothetical protein ACYS8W_15735 [Planctomycetota bacterium]|jgi:hypothetical protein